MKTTRDIIKLWENWHPTTNYVCPSQVSLYYWKKHLITKQNKPLFPSDETNDIAAVIAGSKPAAIADVQPCNMLQKELLEITIKEKIYGRFADNQDVVIVSQSLNLNEIECALIMDDKFTLGLLLGYPQHNVEEFMKKLGTKKFASYKMDQNYLNNLPIPEFQPPNDWFE